MIIKHNPELDKRIKELIDNNNINVNVADFLNNAFSYTDIFDVNEIKQYIKEGLNEKEAMMQILTRAFDIDYELEENSKVMDDYVLNNLKKLDPKEYINNPYVKSIKSIGKYKKYSLKYIDYEPYQLFPYDDISLEGDKENSRIGYFDHKFSYLALCEGNNIWMSLNPNEIETMKPYIAKADGDVLILGLGMGYIPYMIANKENVRSVTIIEKDPDIISLFNSLIFPLFNNKQKIRIIQDDALSYIKNNKKYDYIFADLWHSAEDGLPLFVSLKRANKNIYCWLEQSMYAYLRRIMISLIEEMTLGYDENNYKFAKSYADKVINKFYQKTKNLIISSNEDLDKLLNKDNLLSLVINN